MIRHICMFTLKDEGKAALVHAFLEKAEMLKAIGGIRRFEAVRNDLRTPATNYDVALILDFDTVDDLNAYQKSPIHVEFGEFVYTIRKDRACIDYEF
ncbi:MAG: Dabb family protein [Clostridiales bacterium]|nr:Dabb family protein [Clostridiales bacterium]